MSALEITLPGAARGGWEFESANVREACSLLGLTKPVRVRLTAGERTVGCHRWRNGEHHITVSGVRACEDAGRTLWHELCHAWQYERGSSPERVWATHRASRKRYGYEQSPHEVEARAYSALNDDLPLTRPTRGVALKPVEGRGMSTELGKAPAALMLPLRSLRRVRWTEVRPDRRSVHEALLELGLVEARLPRTSRNFHRSPLAVRRSPAGEVYVQVEHELKAPLRAKAAALLVLGGAGSAEGVAEALGCPQRSAEAALRDLVRHGYARTENRNGGRVYYSATKEAQMATSTTKAAEAKPAREPRKPLTRKQAEAAVKQHKPEYALYVKAQVAKDEAEKAAHREGYQAYRAAYKDLLDHKRAAGELPAREPRPEPEPAAEAPAEPEPTQGEGEYDHGAATTGEAA